MDVIEISDTVSPKSMYNKRQHWFSCFCVFQNCLTGHVGEPVFPLIIHALWYHQGNRTLQENLLGITSI